MFKYIAFIFLLAQLHALPYESDSQIGLGYDTNKSEIKTSPFTDFEIKTVPKQDVKQKIVQIKSFEELLYEIDIEKTLSILKNKKIKKLLSNSHINDYTLTYLIYNRVTNFESSIKIDKQNCNATYIDTIDIGGEFIALIHIKTKSSNDYKKIEKIKVSWENINKFEKELKIISTTHTVTFKNIITADDTIFPANNLKTLIQNAKTFTRDIKNHEVPYEIHLENNTNQTSIKPYLEALQAVNNLEYIRRNTEQFSYDKNSITPTIQSKNISKLFRNITNETMNILQTMVKQINYPKRHNAFTNDIPTEIPAINLPSKIIEKKYPKILENTILSVNYDFKIEVLNSGKIVLLKWIKTVKEASKLIHKEENSKILFDSYINFKDLKATHIAGNNFGSMSFNTKFDSYEKSKSLQGVGIIDSADCGYKIIDQNGTLEIGCENIILKKLDIKFKHQE